MAIAVRTVDAAAAVAVYAAAVAVVAADTNSTVSLGVVLCPVAIATVLHSQCLSIPCSAISPRRPMAQMGELIK